MRLRRAFSSRPQSDLHQRPNHRHAQEGVAKTQRWERSNGGDLCLEARRASPCGFPLAFGRREPDLQPVDIGSLCSRDRLGKRQRIGVAFASVCQSEPGV